MLNRRTLLILCKLLLFFSKQYTLEQLVRKVLNCSYHSNSVHIALDIFSQAFLEFPQLPDFFTNIILIGALLHYMHVEREKKKMGIKWTKLLPVINSEWQTYCDVYFHLYFLCFTSFQQLLHTWKNKLCNLKITLTPCSMRLSFLSVTGSHSGSL